MTTAAQADDDGQLSGGKLALAAITLALANFLVVLDTTIANVSVPHIAGSLGISPSQGVWIITSYAVAEAICVPLTGWLAQRFGAVPTFFWSMVGFTAFSILCGVSTSLGMLIVARIGQGICGGPLMPLSQTLLLRIFGRERTGAAMGIWSVTTVIGPILGPILGGIISDNASWNWIFFINVPVGLFVVFGARRFLATIVMPTRRVRLDVMGLVLLIVWVGALQLVLDLGREHDWFGDPLIVVLTIVAAIGFAMFLAWELTEHEPVVDLRVFRHRGFTAGVTAQSAGYAAFFAGIVLVPQWLQQSLGYTATWAGYATAFIGVGSLVMSPVVAKLTESKDSRLLASIGLLGLGYSAYMRVGWTSGADFWTLSMPQLVQGFFTAFFFIPLATLALGSVKVEETASAAGVMSFLRTVGGCLRGVDRRDPLGQPGDGLSQRDRRPAQQCFCRTRTDRQRNIARATAGGDRADRRSGGARPVHQLPVPAVRDRVCRFGRDRMGGTATEGSAATRCRALTA